MIITKNKVKLYIHSKDFALMQDKWSELGKPQYSAWAIKCYGLRPFMEYEIIVILKSSTSFPNRESK